MRSRPVRERQIARQRMTSQLIIDGDDDPLEWWRIHVRDFPLLSQFARRYLAIQASSAPSERLFSKAGQILTPQRAQLKPDKANMLVFLAENL